MNDSIAYALKWLQKNGQMPAGAAAPQMAGTVAPGAQGGPQGLAATFQQPMLPAPPAGLATAYAPASYSPPVSAPRAAIEPAAPVGIAGMYA